MKLRMAGREFGVEGLVIFSLVAYETAALATNVVTQKRTIPPITDMLGPMTHHRWGKIGVWIFLGWAWDHFWSKGESEFIKKMKEIEAVANDLLPDL